MIYFEQEKIINNFLFDTNSVKDSEQIVEILIPTIYTFDLFFHQTL